MVTAIDNSFEFYHYKGLNRICFKKRSISDRITQYLRSPPLWSIYHTNATKTDLRRSESFIVNRFISGTGPEELAEIGKLRYSEGRAISLPSPREITRPISEILKARRSSRNFNSAWTAEDLSTLLSAAYGITHITSYGKKLRAYPSPGALYPNDLYVVVRNVVGIERGLYIYDIYTNRLVVVTGDTGELLAGFPEEAQAAKVIILLVGSPFRTCLKYGEVGYKFMILDAGIIIENLVLVAVAMNKNATPYESYLDNEINPSLGLDGLRQFVTSTILLG